MLSSSTTTTTTGKQKWKYIFDDYVIKYDQYYDRETKCSIFDDYVIKYDQYYDRKTYVNKNNAY